jgi:putative toxin-antitoxin system, antitoxin component
MTMNADDIEAVVFYRKQKAYSTFKEAEEMIATAHWNLAIQRLYYAAFYMASALLVKNKISAQTHNGVVGQLGMHFVKTGKLNKEDGRLYSRLLQNRITGDYNDFFDFTDQDAIELLEPTRALLEKLKDLIDKE